MVVKAGQTFYDMVIQESGSLDNAFAMSLANERSQTDELSNVDTIDPAGKIQRLVTALFDMKQPATGITEDELSEAVQSGGIGQMRIEVDFIVAE